MSLLNETISILDQTRERRQIFYFTKDSSLTDQAERERRQIFCVIQKTHSSLIDQTTPTMADILRTVLSWMLPVATIGAVLFVQVMFWMPTVSSKETSEEKKEETEESRVPTSSKTIEPADNITSKNDRGTTKNSNTTDATNNNDDDEDWFKMNDNNTWRCACEGGFLPPGMLKTFGGAEAMMRLGTGQCYHKQT